MQNTRCSPSSTSHLSLHSSYPKCFYLLPPRYPPLSVCVHVFSSFFFFPISPKVLGSSPGSCLSARFTPSLLVKSPTPPSIPPLERVPPTPSATPPWIALMFLSPVTSVESLSVGRGRVSKLEGGGVGRGRGIEGERKSERGTFGGVGCFVLAPVAENFIFYPGHIGGVGLIVLFLRPLRHDWAREIICVISSRC